MKVLLIVIDGAAPRVVVPAIQTGQLPVLQQLAEAGTIHQESVAIFPSITPAATTSIITGAYPARSGIAGAAWYDEATRDVAYYGDDFWVIAREGFRAFLRDFLVRLNGDRLQVPTLFELVEHAGRSAASVNYLVYKGRCTHKIRFPLLLALLPGVPLTDVVRGPSVLCLGDFVSTRTLRGKKVNGKPGVLHRFGMDDSSSGQYLIELAEDHALPDFTVAYFADNDYRSHEVGPYEALDTVKKVDTLLGQAFDAAGGLDQLLTDTYVIVTSDHGHCEVLDDRARAAIRLDDDLGEFKKAALGKPWTEDDDMMICPNMRAAQIYLHGADTARAVRAIEALRADPRIDHVMWRTVDTRDGAESHTVASQAGSLEFWPGTDGPDRATDAFGTAWSWKGDLEVVGAAVEDGRLEWTDYPNAFERIVGSLDSRYSGMLWVTAVPGCEFEVEGGSPHLGGSSHGALHALDSYSPLIVAGPDRVRLPQHLRSVDVAPLCLDLLGMTMRYGVGDPRL